MCGNLADPCLPTDEEVDRFDMFIGVTNDAGSNLVELLLAKNLGEHAETKLLNDLVRGQAIQI